MTRSLVHPSGPTVVEFTDQSPGTSSGRLRPVRALIGWFVFALVFAALWFTAGPTQLGGPANYVIVAGPSMEPTYQEGDLVLARAKASYEVGDVVAYLPDIGQDFPVIHRIVGIEGDGRYITQGDNRAQPDGWLATDANIYGAAWLHIPYGGMVIVLLRQPATWLAAAIAMLGLGLIAGARHDRARRRWFKRGRHAKRYSLLPPILVLFAFTANAANLAVDGGVMQAFQIELGLGVPVEPVLDLPIDPEPGVPVAPDPGAPVSNAGENQSVAVGAAVILDGSGSTDPDWDSLTYAWALTVPAGSAATLDDATSATPGFIADVAGTYTAELTVGDGQSVSQADSVVITAIGSVQPAITLTGLELPTHSIGILRMTLSEAAGPGGQEVALASDPAALTSHPPVVTIPEGESEAEVDLMSGNVAGVSTIVAISPGFESGAAPITVTARTMTVQTDEVADLGTTADGMVVLGEPAPVGGITITLASSDPDVVGVSPAVVTIDEGQTKSSFSVTGEAEGVAVITVSAPGYLEATIEVAIAPTP